VRVLREGKGLPVRKPPCHPILVGLPNPEDGHKQMIKEAKNGNKQIRDQNFRGYYIIVARHNGKCLDVKGQSKGDCAEVFQWPIHGGDNQQWKLQRASDGYYHIVAKHSQKCLDVSGGSKDNYANVFQYHVHGGDNQKWSFQKKSKNTFRIIAKHSGKALQAAGQSNDTKVFQYHLTNDDGQEWEFRRVPLAIKTRRIIRKCVLLTVNPIRSSLRARWFLIILGLAITFLSIAYWPTLLENWPWGGKDVVKWMETPVEAFGGVLVLIGLLGKYRRSRRKAMKATLILLVIVSGATYGYHRLDESGKIDEWLHRSSQEDTLGGMIKQVVPSIKDTVGKLHTVAADKLRDAGSIVSSAFEDNNVWVDGAYLVGAKGNAITLHNNSNATNPSWSQLVDFLRQDNTDQQTYSYQSFVCADFAEMLHNNAEKAGWRCAYVCVDLSIGGHALDAFETPDRGLVYIDCTNSISPSPGSADKIVNVKVGEPYIPESIFPTPGWYSTWDSMGTVTKIETVTW